MGGRRRNAYAASGLGRGICLRASGKGVRAGVGGTGGTSSSHEGVRDVAVLKLCFTGAWRAIANELGLEGKERKGEGGQDR